MHVLSHDVAWEGYIVVSHGLCRGVVAPCFLVPRIVVCEPGRPSHGPEEGRERGGGERGGERGGREGGRERGRERGGGREGERGREREREGERGRERGREREREGDGLVKESLPSEKSLPLPRTDSNPRSQA